MLLFPLLGVGLVVSAAGDLRVGNLSVLILPTRCLRCWGSIASGNAFYSMDCDNSFANLCFWGLR